MKEKDKFRAVDEEGKIVFVNTDELIPGRRESELRPFYYDGRALEGVEMKIGWYSQPYWLYDFTLSGADIPSVDTQPIDVIDTGNSGGGGGELSGALNGFAAWRDPSWS